MLTYIFNGLVIERWIGSLPNSIEAALHQYEDRGIKKPLSANPLNRAESCFIGSCKFALTAR